MSEMKFLGQRRMVQAIQRRESLEQLVYDLRQSQSNDAIDGAQEVAMSFIRQAQKAGFVFKTPDAISAGVINDDSGALLRLAGEKISGGTELQGNLRGTCFALALLAAPHINYSVKYIAPKPGPEKRGEDAPLSVRIVGMPDREELTSIERDEGMEITKTTRISKDLPNA